MILSLLICTVYDRAEKFKLLFDYLNKINVFADVEILFELDNKEISVGAKRQKLIERAKGKFVVFIDDDDWVAENYISEIRKGILENPEIDCIGFLQSCTFNGSPERKICCLSLKYKVWRDNVDGYYAVRSPYHKTPIKREVALRVGFQDMRFAEDHDFSKKVTPLLKNEYFINKIMYQYRYTEEEHNKKYGIKR